MNRRARRLLLPTWLRGDRRRLGDLASAPSRKSAVTWHLLTSLVLQGVLVAHAFLLVPLAVGTVGAKSYGFWLASGGLLGWLGLTNFGSATVTLQRCAHAYGSRDLQATRDWFAHGLVAAAVSSLVLACLVIPLAAFAPRFLAAPAGVRSDLTQAIVLAALGTALIPANDTARGFLCALQRNGVGVGAEIIGGLGSLAVAWFGLSHGWGLRALGAGLLFRGLSAGLVNGTAAAWFMRQAAPRTMWQRDIFGEYVQAGASLWSASAVGQLVPQLPPLLLTTLVGPESAVAYTATSRPLMICEMLPAFAIGSMSSAISHMTGDVTAQARLHSHLSALGGLLSFATIVSAAAYCLGNAGFVGLWMGKEYYLGPWFTACAATAAVVASQVRWSSGITTALGAVGSTARVLSWEGLGRAALMPLLVSAIGPCGIPIATVICGVAILPLLEKVPGDSDDRLASATSSAVFRRLLLAVIPLSFAAVLSTYWPPVGWLDWAVFMAMGTLGCVIGTTIVFPNILQVMASLRLALGDGSGSHAHG